MLKLIFYSFYTFSLKTFSGKINPKGTAVPLLSAVLIFYTLPFLLLFLSRINGLNSIISYSIIGYFILMYYFVSSIYTKLINKSIDYYTNVRPKLILQIFILLLSIFSIVFFLVSLYLFRVYDIM